MKFGFLILVLMLAGCINDSSQLSSKSDKPTLAAQDKLSPSISHFNIENKDDFSWLRDPQYPNISDPRILNHLDKEQKKTDAFFADYKKLTNEVFEEIKNSWPSGNKPQVWEDKRYIYSSKYIGSDDYKTLSASDKTTGVTFQLISENDRAAGFNAYELQKIAISPNKKIIAWIEDTTGTGYGILYFKDLSTNRMLPKKIKRIGKNFVWSHDSKSIFYIGLDDGDREYQLRVHHVGQETIEDQVIYTEKDNSFILYMDQSISGDMLFLVSFSQMT